MLLTKYSINFLTLNFIKHHTPYLSVKTFPLTLILTLLQIWMKFSGSAPSTKNRSCTSELLPHWFHINRLVLVDY